MNDNSVQVSRSSLAPSDFFEQLKDATVPFEKVMNFNDPVGGYVNYLKESFAGDKTIMLRIIGNEARLMTIGLYPFKGRSAIANTGYLSCKVDSAETGSVIRSYFQMAWIYKLAIPVFLILASLMLVAIVVLVRYGGNLDGRLALIGAATFFMFLFTGFSLNFLRGAKTQLKLTRDFLKKLIEENMQS